MKLCQRCGQSIAEQAFACPSCGEPFSAGENADGWGFEYKSEASMFGLPILHISFKYRTNRRPVVARGIIAIGQFACGVVTISQFGLGLFSISQLTIAGYALAQFALAYSLIAQFGVYYHYGVGQFVISLAQALPFLR